MVATRARSHPVTGRVVYEPDDGLTIELESAGHVLQFFQKIPVMLGMTVEGQPVTLRSVVGGPFRWNRAGGSTASGRVGEAIIGLHAPAATDLRLHSLKAQITSLTEWIGSPAFDLLGAFPTGGRIRYEALRPEVVARSGGKTFTVYGDVGGVEPRPRGHVSTSIALNQRSWVLVQPRWRRDLDELWRDVARFAGMLSFISGRDCPLTELVGEATLPARSYDGLRLPRHRERVWILFNRSVGETTPTDAQQMLFGFGYAKEVGFRPIARWFRRTELLEPIYNLYLSSIPTQSPRIEFRFLALAQALDAYYYRRFSKQLDFVDVVRALERELPGHVRRQIPPRFAPFVKDTRHYFTHWNKKYEKRAAKGNDLVALTFGLMVMVELLLLRELGLSKTEVAAIADENFCVSQIIRSSFGRLSGT